MKFFFTSLSFFSHIKFWCAFSTHGYIQSVNGVMYKCTSWHLNNDYEKDTLCKAQFFERCIMYYNNSEDTLSNVSNISLFADTKHKCGRGLPLFSQQTFFLNLHVHKMFWNVMESPPPHFSFLGACNNCVIILEMKIRNLTVKLKWSGMILTLPLLSPFYEAVFSPTFKNNTTCLICFLFLTR